MAFSMRVKKRNGSTEPVSFDKVLGRIRKAARDLRVNPDALAQQVLSGIYDGVTTTELDELASQTASSLSSNHPDWGILSSRIAISNHHKKTEASFSKVMLLLSSQVNPKRGGDPVSYVSDEVVRICSNPEFAATLDAAIVPDRDYLFDFFGFKTLEKSYLLKDADLVIRERPQHMWMRVALCLWGENMERVIETYNMLSLKKFTHATPTLFSAGTPRQQLSSCFLLTMADDSISGIYDTLKECAMISKHAGGIGLSCHTIRAKGSAIMGTNGISDGLVPMLRVFDSTACYVNQGGRRNGSFAIYISPDHADIEDVLRLKLNNGLEKERARDLFYGLWIPDLFMKRVEENSDWSLFCPSEAPGLADVYGKEYETLYEKYEAEGRARKKVSAQKLWFQILDAQMETGTPYLLYKDAANEKSNQKNLGTIRSSNLCTEILEFSSPDETAVCNLASLSLPAFVMDGVFDYAEFEKTVRVAVRNLNRVIDINFYPTPKTERSNMRHRPVGLGVQGLADVFAMMKLSWESPDALELNQRIFEHMYYYAVDESSNLATVEGSYSTFQGSPASQGLLQPDLWKITPITQTDGGLDWDGLRKKVVMNGLRNSLLVAPMPTASTAQILGNTECFEPITTNMYSRRVLAGEYPVINKHLLKELIELELWSDKVKSEIVARYGSVQNIPEIPLEIQARYKTIWEISQKTLIDMAAARGAFIDQSQSLNLFIEKPTYANLTSMHFYGWKAGLKTGCYYLRTKAQAAAQQFTVDPRLLAAISTGGPAVIEDDEEYVSSDEEVEDETSRLQAIAAKKFEERKKLRENLDSLDLGSDICTNCSS
jgi:ribonucleoside-diphosphate reductase alpha subunit